MTRSAAASPRASLGALSPRGGLARSSLFGRRIPPTRREALSLATLPAVDREAIRKDAQGFDDVDAFFAPSILSPAPAKGAEAARNPSPLSARTKSAALAAPDVGAAYCAEPYAGYDATYDGADVPVDFGADYAPGGLAGAESPAQGPILGEKTPPKRSPGRPRKYPRPDDAGAKASVSPGANPSSVDEEISAALFSPSAENSPNGGTAAKPVAARGRGSVGLNSPLAASGTGKANNVSPVVSRMAGGRGASSSGPSGQSAAPTEQTNTVRGEAPNESAGGHSAKRPFGGSGRRGAQSRSRESSVGDSASSLSPAKGAPKSRAGRPRKDAQRAPPAASLAQRLLLPQGRARLRVAPLKYWMNERIVRRPSAASAAPVVDVVRASLPDETEVPRRVSRKRKPAHRDASPRLPNADDSHERADGPPPGFVEKVRVEARTIDYESNRETSRTVAVGPDEVDAPLISGESFGIQTLFTEGGFVSAGVLRFPPGAAKPPRNSSRHALLFHVVRGSFEVTLHRQAFVVGTGCHFLVPRGNHYALRATWPAGDSVLFFCHCRDASVDD